MVGEFGKIVLPDWVVGCEGVVFLELALLLLSVPEDLAGLRPLLLL